LFTLVVLIDAAIRGLLFAHTLIENIFTIFKPVVW